MPGFNSHYIFGRNALDSFTPNQYEQFLIRYPQSFHLGLQGPDIFIYSPGANLFYKPGISTVLHTKKVTDFIEMLIVERNKLLTKEHRTIADAYIAGFLAHYTFDSMTHPYIYCRTKHSEHEEFKDYDFGLHVFLETDIDNALLRHYMHLKPSEFASGDTIKLSTKEHMIISILVYKAINHTYDDITLPLFIVRHAISCMSLLSNMVVDPKGIKKWGVRLVERFITGYAVISPRIAGDKVTTYRDPCNLRHKTWFNPFIDGKKHTDSVYDIIDKATPILIDRIHNYAKSQTLSREVSADEKAACLDRLMTSIADDGVNYDGAAI